MNKTTIRDGLTQSGAWITLVTAAFLVVFFFINSVQDKRQQESLDKQTSNTLTLIQEVKKLGEQNKELSEQNRDLSQQNTRYAYCNAVILAKYTQTGDPIQIDDLNDCVLTTFPDDPEIINGGNAGAAVTQPSLNNLQGSGSSQTASSPANTTPTGNSPQNPVQSVPPVVTNPQPAPVSKPNLSVDSTFVTPKIELKLPCINIPSIIGVC